MSQILCKRCHGSGEGDPASDRPFCWECGGKGYVASCSVEGCDYEATENCDLCRQAVCERHHKSAMGMDLCFSCHIGMGEGMGMMKDGWR
jgi:RecJ-like exonuclease